MIYDYLKIADKVTPHALQYVHNTTNEMNLILNYTSITVAC